MQATDPLIWTIRGYQKLISPLTPPVCRFTPSCSHYAVEALAVHGVVRGSVLAAWRIARCNPYVPGGPDPVPPPPGRVRSSDPRSGPMSAHAESAGVAGEE